MQTKKPAAKKRAAKKPAAKKRAAKKTPDVIGALGNGRVRVRQVGTGMTTTISRAEWDAACSKSALQIADELEAEAKKLQSAANILRGV